MIALSAVYNFLELSRDQFSGSECRVTAHIGARSR